MTNDQFTILSNYTPKHKVEQRKGCRWLTADRYFANC